MKSIRRQRGVTLLEQLVALAALTIVATAAVMLMGSTEDARREAQPAAELVWTRATAAQELALCESAAADLAFFDIDATLAAVRGGPGGGGPGGGGPGRPGGKKTSGAAVSPPSGYCGPVVVGRPDTYPPGFDPKNKATWSSVRWWPAIDRDNPATWYYECGTPRPPARVSPVYSYGDGVLFAGGTGDPVPVVGPAAVVPESTPLFTGQTGDAVVLLRTEPSMPRLALGAAFDSSGSSIRLVAGDDLMAEAIGRLAAGDVLVVTGPGGDGETRTAVAELQATPAPVEWPSPLDEAGQPVLRYFQAGVAPSTGDFRWGLRNAPAAAAGISIGESASVAVLDRAAGVVVFHTLRGESGTELVKVTGGQAGGSRSRGPVLPPSTSGQVLVRGAAAPLAAEVRTVTLGTGSAARAVAAGLTVAMPIAGEDGEMAEPLAATVEFVGAATTNTRLGLVMGTVTEDVSFPGPVVGGGGLGEVPEWGGEG